MQKSQIKPCPLCGGKARAERGAIGMWAIVCPCSSHVFFGVEGSKEKTIKRWNKRNDYEYK